MLFQSLVEALLATTAIATPTNRVVYEECKSPAYKKEAKPTWGTHHWGQDWQKKGGKGPFKFTSTYEVMAVPDQVVDANNTATGGLVGARGHYLFGINSEEDYICYHITLYGIDPNTYQSPATTATHIHEAARGRSGPPRLAFANPRGNKDKATSIGCLQFPYTTGIKANGQDTGTNFTVRRIEQNPSAFFADVHTSSAVPGAIRGQLA